MFACALYDLTEEFEENVRRELIDNIRRIRSHPSLGLWCGNNEMEMFTDTEIWGCTPRQKADYIKLYEYIIPKILKEEDPYTFYWPASPSSGGSFDNPNDENREMSTTGMCGMVISLLQSTANFISGTFQNLVFSHFHP